MWALLLALAPLAAPAQAADTPAAAFSRLYGELLARYWRAPVRIGGVSTTVFDYAAMKAAGARGDSLVERIAAALEATDPARLQERDAQMAFWINAYNFGAMRLVLDAYPVDSIRSLKISLIRYPWSRPAVNVGGREHSLKEIEKEILLGRYGDPRIVFAVSCAAVSCPDRTSEPFTGERLNAQLDAMIRAFFSNPDKGLRLDLGAGTARLSWILEKDADLFGGEAGVRAFVARYLPREAARRLAGGEIALEYFEHDWTLNDLAQADEAP